jgi:hypothetical protein|tara:strand:+ start:831 stop:1019 length:189 start_codon:yes stop_codon:yes gene_type:complete
MIELSSNIKCHDADSDYPQSFAKFKSFFYKIVLWVQGMLVAMPLVNIKPPSNSQLLTLWYLR